MKSKPSNRAEETKNTAQNYRHALFALLSQKTEKIAACPPPEALAAFAEGRLFGKKRRLMISHLADCAACRHQWQLVVSTLEEQPPIKAPTLYQRLRSIRLKQFFLGGGFGLALTTSLLLLLFTYSGQDELNRMLARSYAELSPNDISRFNSFEPKGEDMAGEGVPSQGRSAYKAGLAEGRRRLLDASKKMTERRLEDKGITHLYYLGQWVVLLQCSCISHEPPVKAFWAEQLEISTKLRDKIKNAAKVENETINRQIVSAVDRIEEGVRRINRTGGKVEGCDGIASAIEMLENVLNE